MKKTWLSLFLVTALLIPACTPAASAGILKSDKERSAAQVSESDLSTLVHNNNDFTFQLYQELKDENGNIFYSPYSISQALAMAYAGARGDTEQEMAETLRFTLPQDQLHPAFNDLDTILASRGEGAQGKDGGDFRLNIINAIWGQQNYPFLPEYLDKLALNYGAGLRTLDFVKEPDQSRVTINDWVSEQTEARIKDLLPDGSINGMTRLVLTNAVYFNAAWQYPFNKNATHDADFYLLDGSPVSVSMMQETKSLNYYDGNQYQAVELPYDGGELSLVILLPRSGNYVDFETSLNVAKVENIINNLQHQQVALSLPKFEFDSSFSMKQTLSAMGMTDAFTDNADFSGMSGNKDLSISEVYHKSFISVDETGTEAAAATAVVAGVTSMPASPVTMTLDHPFIFFIRDIDTGAIIFAGRVMDPSN